MLGILRADVSVHFFFTLNIL